ncbi:hypothetical protein INT44_003095 [Umbelopsis vinacea]|uniref:Pre-mRNA-splicing factor CWC2 n=1 Tax=Umbelopsis vinacea TaxID=44442 RepID=A0A8H7Q7Y0_9FUNG|nr:hypothetical protein INT44_003095 [Umbelopsis vinacea]
MPLARQQVTESEVESVHKEEIPEGSTYNIWSGKWQGGKREQHTVKTRPKYRCNIERDAGTTAGSDNPQSYFCLHFARGMCSQGPRCAMWHRIPTESDEVEATIDSFGRDKYLEYKKDMGGVGSFNFDNRTLYVGRVTVSDAMEEIVRRHFSEWGPIESVKVLKRRGVAFVTYQMRSNAEFAKEAMKYQSLDNNEMLNIRWASDDPNPTPAVSEVPEKKRRIQSQYADDGESELPAEYTSRAQEVDEDGFMNMEMRIKLERAAEAEKLNRSLQEQAAALNYWNYYQPGQPVTTEAAQVPETDKKDSIISSQALETLKQLQQKNAGAAKKQGGGLQALATYGSDSEDED